MGNHGVVESRMQQDRLCNLLLFRRASDLLPAYLDSKTIALEPRPPILWRLRVTSLELQKVKAHVWSGRGPSQNNNYSLVY